MRQPGARRRIHTGRVSGWQRLSNCSRGLSVRAVPGMGATGKREERAAFRQAVQRLEAEGLVAAHLWEDLAHGDAACVWWLCILPASDGNHLPAPPLEQA